MPAYKAFNCLDGFYLYLGARLGALRSCRVSRQVLLPKHIVQKWEGDGGSWATHRPGCGECLKPGSVYSTQEGHGFELFRQNLIWAVDEVFGSLRAICGSVSNTEASITQYMVYVNPY